MPLYSRELVVMIKLRISALIISSEILYLDMYCEKRNNNKKKEQKGRKRKEVIFRTIIPKELANQPSQI